MIERDGWIYHKPELDRVGDARKLVTLREDGMTWVGIRAWNDISKRWVNNGEPERAEVVAWKDLDQPAQGYYDRGVLFIPKYQPPDPASSRPARGTEVPGERTSKLVSRIAELREHAHNATPCNGEAMKAYDKVLRLIDAIAEGQQASTLVEKAASPGSERE